MKRSPFYLSVCTVCLISCSGALIIDNTAAKEEARVRKSEELYKSGIWTVREKAVEEAEGCRSKRAEKFLTAAVSDSHERVRISALKVLSGIHTDSAFYTILERARIESETNVRWESLRALAVFRRAEAFPVFMSAFNDRDWLIRETAVSGLLDIRDKKIAKSAVDTAVAALSDPSENVRIAALSHLTATDFRIYQFLSRQVGGGAYYRRTEYLKVMLRALSLYKLDKEMRVSILGYITHPNAEIRVLALQVIRSSDERGL
jgi:hypothetical protein